MIKILEEFNLSEKEARVYVANLQVGKGTVYEIAKRADIKRPTVYVLAEGLVKKGLLNCIDNKGKMVCSPVPPRRLVEGWKGRVEALEAICPDLSALYNKAGDRPGIQVFESERGIDFVYHELTPKDTKKEELLIFGSIPAIKERFGYRFKVWSRVVRSKRNRIKELINLDEGAEEYAQRMKSLGNPNYEIRIMRQDVFGRSDNIIYKNKLALFSLKKELCVVVIESEEVVKTYRALFEAGWRGATKFNY